MPVSWLQLPEGQLGWPEPRPEQPRLGDGVEALLIPRMGDLVLGQRLLDEVDGELLPVEPDLALLPVQTVLAVNPPVAEADVAAREGWRDNFHTTTPIESRAARRLAVSIRSDQPATKATKVLRCAIWTARS
jgi:hypothetical protein